jgi:hypothetical protein
VSAALLASRRTLRIATRASSASSLIRAVIFLRTSVESGGITIRITRPSLCGLKPRSAACSAFSMSLIVPGSNGRTTIWFGSGAPTLASALMGVGEP